VAGALSLEDAARVVALRSRSIAAHLAGKGGMISLALSQTDVLERIDTLDGLSIAAVNGPTATVVSGDPTQIDELARTCEADGIRARVIPVDYASHSQQVEIIESELAQILSGLKPQTPRVPFFSTLECTWITEPTLDATYWYRNLRHPVGFAPAIETLATTEGFTHFIEVSAHPVLTMALPDTVTGLSTLRREQGGLDRLITSLAEAWTNGLPLDWTPVLPAATGDLPDLPTYAFQTERFWLQSSAPTSAADDWRYRVEWQPLTASGQAALSGRWLVAAGSEPDAELLGALKAAGAEVEVLEAGADGDRGALAARLAALTTGEGGFTGVVSLLDGLVPQVAWVQALG
ncbi:acyltransferase domain-containing protein, partial [Streptomyces narbonensis]|uniref:acyltransferase domain-containing protein n=1 Tax=Streptomyces narbonensis TaxID=67333 RepID=UPI001677A3CB